jgi:hypothetical protein
MPCLVVSDQVWIEVWIVQIIFFGTREVPIVIWPPVLEEVHFHGWCSLKSFPARLPLSRGLLGASPFVLGMLSEQLYSVPFASIGSRG